MGGGGSYSRSLRGDLKRVDGSCSMSDVRLGREAESRLDDLLVRETEFFCTEALSTLSV